MLETLIAILLSLGLNFTKTDDGKILVDRSSLTKLEASADYQKSNPSADSPIVIVPDIDPEF